MTLQQVDELKVWLVLTRPESLARATSRLGRAGCRLDGCDDADHARKLLGLGEPPHMAVVDCDLPGGQAPALCADLAGLADATRTVVIQRPGAEEQVAGCLAHGVTACLAAQADGSHWRLVEALAGGLKGGVSEAARLCALEQERSNLLSMLVHDMKSPLISIRGFADLIRRKAEDLPPEKAARYAEVITNESAKLEGLIGDFLEASRQKVGSLKLKLAPVDLKAELLELALVFKPRYQAADIILDLTGLEGLPALTADAGRLRRALNNLLENALLYSPGGSRVQVAAAADDGELKVEVRDQGAGIPPEEQEMIFQPFYRGKGQPKGHGHGLGLAGVRAIAEAHGGRILLASQPGSGSAFTLVLPLDAAG